MTRMLRTDQIAELQIMLEAHGAPAVLAALAEACADRAGFLRQLGPHTYTRRAALLAKQAKLIHTLAKSYAIQGE